MIKSIVICDRCKAQILGSTLDGTIVHLALEGKLIKVKFMLSKYTPVGIGESIEPLHLCHSCIINTLHTS